MRLHTKLTHRQVWEALQRAKDAGHVTPDVGFTTDVEHRSNTHPHAYELQLGTYDKNSLPAGYTDQNGHRLTVRRFKNSGKSGAESGWYEPAVWSATWDEWGWLMAEIFAFDPDARWGSLKGWGYNGVADFNAKTQNKFAPDMLFPKGYSV